MKTLLELISNIRKKSEKYGKWLERLNPSLPNAFNMIFNDITLTLELLSHYYNVWSKPSSGIKEEEFEQLREENAERILKITKWAFVSALSSIEYCLKETLKVARGRITSIPQLKELRRDLLAGTRVYLRRITRQCRRAGIIDDEQYRVWECLIEVRNAIVHNNAIADRNIEYRINDIMVTFSRGKMLRGKLDFFTKLLKIAIDQYYMLIKCY